jgi:hypothetical protein
VTQTKQPPEIPARFKFNPSRYIPYAYAPPAETRQTTPGEKWGSVGQNAHANAINLNLLLDTKS